MRIGVDLVHIPSFRQKISREGFLTRIFHARECEDARAEHLAGIYAVKEALFKADNSIQDWLEVEVRSSNGVTLIGPKVDGRNVSASITHEKDYACAMVVINEDHP